MTTNQTIDGVPRELLADLADYGESGKAPEPWMVDKLRALLDAPAVSAPLSIPDECPHMIVFDDTDREHMVFAGAGARDAALKTWDKISGSWNAHLFVRIERNSRDDRYPSAAFVPAAQPQGEPVAWLNVATGHVTTSAVVVMDWDDEKEQVQSLYAEQPAPVAVVLPERLTQAELEELEVIEAFIHGQGLSNLAGTMAAARQFIDEVTRLNAKSR